MPHDEVRRMVLSGAGIPPDCDPLRGVTPGAPLKLVRALLGVLGSAGQVMWGEEEGVEPRQWPISHSLLPSAQPLGLLLGHGTTGRQRRAELRGAVGGEVGGVVSAHVQAAHAELALEGLDRCHLIREGDWQE
jgi:hypothetical protein